MTTLRRAAQQALEALWTAATPKAEDAIAALRTALAESRDSTKTVVESEQRTEPEQEPVELTDWEIDNILFPMGQAGYRERARAVIAAYQAKQGGQA